MSCRPGSRRSRLVAAATLLAQLAGCGGLLSGPPERQLYQLNPTFAVPAGLPHVSAQLLVAAPTAPAGLDTTRIALSRSPVSLDYFADAQWTDRAPFLVQSALVDGFEKSGAVKAVGPDSADLRADFVLETGIRHFEAVYDSPSGPARVVVALNLRLVRMPARSIVAQTVVRQVQTAAANTIDAIVQGFDAALGGAAGKAVAWAVSSPALSARQGLVLSRTRFVQDVERAGADGRAQPQQ